MHAILTHSFWRFPLILFVIYFDFDYFMRYICPVNICGMSHVLTNKRIAYNSQYKT